MWWGLRKGCAGVTWWAILEARESPASKGGSEQVQRRLPGGWGEFKREGTRWPMWGQLRPPWGRVRAPSRGMTEGLWAEGWQLPGHSPGCSLDKQLLNQASCWFKPDLQPCTRPARSRLPGVESRNLYQALQAIRRHPGDWESIVGRESVGE